MIIDADMVSVLQIVSIRVLAFQMKTGPVLFANSIALGLLVKVTEVVTSETIKKAVEHRVLQHTVEKIWRRY